MNRLIKFRVWSKKYKMFNNNVGWPDSQRVWEEFLLDVNGNLKEFITNDNENFFCNSTNDEDFVVQQFTGLVDKNNREIYEGDIIQYRNLFYDKWVDEIKFTYGCFILNGITMNMFSSSELEIIGNICQNPELLISDNTLKTIESSIKNIKDSKPIDLSVHQNG